MKTKSKPIPSLRDERLTIRIPQSDLEDLKELGSMFSPYAPLSQGKTISAAIKFAKEYYKRVQVARDGS